MGQSPETLRNDIAETRRGMSDTLEAIGDHVSPGRILERRKNRVVGGVRTVRERVMGTVGDAAGSIADSTGSVADTARHAPDAVVRRTQGSPLGAGAVAFGLGFVAAAVFPASRPETEAAGQLMAKAEPLKDELQHVGQDVVESLQQPARDAVDSVKEAATSGAEQVKATAQDAMPTGGGSDETSAASAAGGAPPSLDEPPRQHGT
jgi:Protein of unknown function (DUF3618)